MTMMKKHWWKGLGVLLVFYTIIMGFLGDVPRYFRTQRNYSQSLFPRNHVVRHDHSDAGLTDLQYQTISAMKIAWHGPESHANWHCKRLFSGHPGAVNGKHLGPLYLGSLLDQ